MYCITNIFPFANHCIAIHKFKRCTHNWNKQSNINIKENILKSFITEVIRRSLILNILLAISNSKLLCYCLNDKGGSLNFRQIYFKSNENITHLHCNWHFRFPQQPTTFIISWLYKVHVILNPFIWRNNTVHLCTTENIRLFIKLHNTNITKRMGYVGLYKYFLFEHLMYITCLSVLQYIQ